MKDSKGIAETNGNDTREMYACYLLGRAMLNKIGLPDGIDPIDAAKELITLWGKHENAPATPNDSPEPTENSGDAGENNNYKQLPRPIKGGMGEAPAIDFDNMSTEQFRRLKKQLQNAARDGKRIRI